MTQEMSRLVASKMKAILLVSSKLPHSCLRNRPAVSYFNSRSSHFIRLNRDQIQSMKPSERLTFQRTGIQRRFMSSSEGSPNLQLGNAGNFMPAAASEIETRQTESATNSLVDTLVTSADPLPVGWTPAALAEYGIVAIHDASGFPWFLSIAGITVALRTALLPLVVYQMRNIARLALIKDDMDAITKRWKAFGGYSAPPQAGDAYQKELKLLFEKNNCNPMTSMIGILVQAPLFISFFFALRHMSVSYPSFKTGGALWFTDLSVTDPLYLLPVASALTMLLSIELGADTGQAMSQQKAGMKLFFRGFACFMVPSLIVAGIPNGVFMYWLSANLFSLMQVLVLKIPGVKAALGIPALPTTSAAQAVETLGPRIPDVVYSARPPQPILRSAAAEAAAVPRSEADTLQPKTAVSKGLRVKRRR